MSVPVAQDLENLRKGGKLKLSRTLSRLEQSPNLMHSLLSECYHAPRAHVIGVTGPPGVGKSTLLSELIQSYRAEGRSVGIIAVDPSSKQSGGAFLGDRVRFSTDPDDQNVFVRSMAARQRLGGLADQTAFAMVLMRAIFDIVLVETVGVGQSETDVSAIVDSVVFCVQPGSGDSLQFMKAGITEIPHIALVTKSDMGKAATRTKADLQGALSLASRDQKDWPVKILALSSVEKEGVTEFISALDEHYLWLLEKGKLASKREEQATEWLFEALRESYGAKGIAFLRTAGMLPGALNGMSPFDVLGSIEQKMNFTLGTGS